jgi:hypothetical protein
MAEFDDRWRRLVAAARSAGEPAGELSARRIRELAALARRLPVARPCARAERRSLVAIAALLACVFFALLPCSAEVGAFLDSVTSDLADLPNHVPRPPRPPSAALALEALPDLHSFLELTPFSTESQP